MTKPMKRIHNADTNEITDAEMTDTEFAQYEAHNAEIAEMQSIAKASQDVAEAKLAALGLTLDDLKALDL